LIGFSSWAPNCVRMLKGFFNSKIMYSYKRTEFSPYELYTVGTYDSGKWESESDHSTKEEAAKRVHYLNGGKSDTTIEIDEIHRMIRERALEIRNIIDAQDPKKMSYISNIESMELCRMEIGNFGIELQKKHPTSLNNSTL
jgi:hypothetical protein